MPRYVALLRGINVGGHVVKMDRLRTVFAAIGCSDVETFIASGNVIFSSPSGDAAALERRAEAALEEALGYEVTTFIRTPEQLQSIAIEADAYLLCAVPFVVGSPHAADGFSVAPQVGDRIDIGVPEFLCIGEHRTFRGGEFSLDDAGVLRHGKDLGARAPVALVGGGGGADFLSLDVQTVRTTLPAVRRGWSP